MRLGVVLVAAALVVLGCSRAPAGPGSVASGDGAVEDAGLPSSLDGGTVASDAMEDDPHAILLGQEPYPAFLDVAAGQSPCAAYPAGTVYVGRFEGDAIRVTEWDLAHKATLRSVPLRVRDGYGRKGGVRLVRAGEGLDAVVWDEGSGVYIAMTRDLTVLAKVPIGEVSSGGPMALASDGRVTIAVTARAPNLSYVFPIEIHAALFDARGRVRARRALGDPSDYGGTLVDGAVFIGERLYVAVPSWRGPERCACPGIATWNVLHLDDKLRVLEQMAFVPPEDMRRDRITGLTFRSGELWLEHTGAGAPVEVSVDGGLDGGAAVSPIAASEDRERDASSEGQFSTHEVWFGREHVAVFRKQRTDGGVPIVLRWTEDDARSDRGNATSPAADR